MKHIFITDEFETLEQGHDSSLAMMRECLKLNQQVWQATITDLKITSNKLTLATQSIVSTNGKLIRTEETQVFDLTQSQPNTIIWMRKDPPVDQSFIYACQLLRLSSIPVLNNPNTLLSCNEKLFALEFPELIPLTHITYSISEIQGLLSHQNKLIAKPINGKGGEGILVLENHDKNLKSMLQYLTNNETNPIIVQEYLPIEKHGDKRVFLLNGEPIGAVLRVPNRSDHRANLAQGGGFQQTTITDKDLNICSTLRPRLHELGVVIAGIDIIANKLTEINITSPTCLEEIHALSQNNPAKQIINWSTTQYS